MNMHIVYRNAYLGNTIIIFVIKQTCWAYKGHMDLTVHNTDLCWNMFIKFSKQMRNRFAKEINTNQNSKPCQTVEMELFPQLVTGFIGKLRILPYI